MRARAGQEMRPWQATLKAAPLQSPLSWTAARAPLGDLKKWILDASVRGELTDC